MTIHEPQCVMWKRLGAEQVQNQIEGLTIAEELAFWRKRTIALAALQEEARSNIPRSNWVRATNIGIGPQGNSGAG